MLHRVPVLLVLSAWAAQAQIPKDPASLAAGKKLYEYYCAFCHGKGDDGFAANLMSPQLPHAPTDNALINIIRSGIPGTDMPASAGMTDREVRQLAGFVRALGRSAPQSVAGDTAKGAAAFRSRCAGCHMVNGSGGRMGPDLSDVGAKRSPANLRTSILDANASIVPGWAVAHVTLNDGLAVSGVKINEDQFSVMIREADGKIHHIDKDSAREIGVDPKSSMPSYKGAIPDGELNDLVAYLFSLRGGM
ncbi:MAG TPA: c-type cytochrome [Bryobacteraceae bacterium]|nr:c-type cytochrome [Bryobacteraceae bacterium]